MHVRGLLMHSRVDTMRAIAPPVEPNEALRWAIESERTATATLAMTVRFVGALGFFCAVLGCWLVTRQMDWFVYVAPLALFTAGAALVLMLRD